MGSYRTVFLLILAAACGIGSGVLGAFSHGLATVALLMAFPFVVAILFLLIVRDVLHERVGDTAPRRAVTAASQAAKAERGSGRQQPKAA